MNVLSFMIGLHCLGVALCISVELGRDSRKSDQVLRLSPRQKIVYMSILLKH